MITGTVIYTDKISRKDDRKELTNIVIIGKVQGVAKHFSVAYSKSVNIGDRIEFPTEMFKYFSGVARGHLKYEEGFSNSGGYSKNDIVDFGMFQGYETGLVYSLDQHYIEWCIKNVESFFIKDLNMLYDFGVFAQSQQFINYRLGAINPWEDFMSHFKSIDNLSRTLAILNNEFRFSQETEQLNEEKKNR